MSESFTELMLPALFALVGQLPIFIVYGIAATLALYHLDRHRRVSLLLVAGVTTLAVANIVSTVVSMAMPMWLLQHSYSRSEVGLASTLVGVASSMGKAVGYGLLLASALIDRAPQERAFGPIA